MNRSIYLVILVTLSTTISAFSLPDIPVNFLKGKTVTAIKARLVAGGRRCYFVKIEKGRSFEATLNSVNKKVIIFESGANTYSEDARISGKYTICIDNLGGPTSYDLTVKIL